MTTDPADMGEHDQLGCITWLSSEDDGGPDCGLVLGLGEGRSLYVGELADATIADAGLDPKDGGWWCALLAGDGFDVVGPVASAGAAQNLVERLEAVLHGLLAHLASLEAENKALRERLNTPEIADFAQGVVLEAAHQRERWGSEQDAGKTPWDWFWLIGYLAQKAASAAVSGTLDKAQHHTISTAGALANWHAALTGADTSMRPGINPEERGYAS